MLCRTCAPDRNLHESQTCLFAAFSAAATVLGVRLLTRTYTVHTVHAVYHSTYSAPAPGAVNDLDAVLVHVQC